jgi:hypothetical protein
MKASTLENRIAKSNNKNGSTPNNRDYEAAMEVISLGFSRVGYYTGSGRFTKASCSNPEKYLNAWGIDFECGNDAPRGGVTGEYVKLTAKGLKQVADYNKVQAERGAKIKAENEAAKAKFEAEKKAAIQAKYENIKNIPFFTKWNDQDLKDASGLSWNAYRNELKVADPQGWAELKAQFKANQK